MSMTLSKFKLDNLAGEIWKSVVRLRGKLGCMNSRSLIHECVTGQRRLTDVEVAAIQAHAEGVAAWRTGENACG